MKWLALALVAFCAAAAGQAAPYLTPEAAASKAGRQRILAEFMVKEYLQIVAGVSAPGARGHLNDAIAVVDDQMTDLKDFARDDETRESVAAVEREWSAFRALAMSPPNRSNAAALYAAGTKFHDAARRNVALIEKRAANARGSLARLSGRQRMLSQRIAKDYLLIVERIEEAAAREELKVSQEQFESAHQQLLAAAADDELRAELAHVDKRWEELRRLLGRAPDRAADHVKVLDATDAILNRMDRVTGLFEKRQS